MAVNAQGSKIEYQAPGSPSAYTAVEEVTNISGPDGSANLIDVSHLGSTGKEYLPGLADNGNITLTCNFTGGVVQMELFDAFNGSFDPAPFRIKIPSDSTRTKFHIFTFNAVVTKWAITEAVDQKVGLNITLQTSGGVHYTAPV